ncbi:MAG: SidA/IucD/PvdA family monooxygenase [Deltaproteobacteria bacterium]|nr:SidA/IucD/PvdA family monooxygenase [Deltaproteobacteria bacterium]MBI3295568.1 SidA/IucD/PvdA family monooxygenase [Deltaproteobacteria bacterium]
MTAPESTKRLIVVGAGPKAMAIAAKASVLREMGFRIPEITLIEQHSIGHHWKPESGFTNGQLSLGTSPEKDVGFPYYSFLWGDSINRKINYRMQRFSWQNHLVDNHEYSEWIDRGKPAPTHTQWANYLHWVFKKVEGDIRLHQARVEELEIADGIWQVKTTTPDGNSVTLEADGVVLTGPGEAKFPFHVPNHPRVLTVPSFWKAFSHYATLERGSIALVGAGETAATIAASLGAANPRIQMDIISPQAMTFSRGESFAENHVYTDPFQANWLQLTRQDRKNFISRTDRGVFSVAMKQELDRLRNVEIVPGKFTKVTVDSLDQLVVQIEYNSGEETRIYDHLIFSAGFDHAGLVNRLLSRNAQADILRQMGEITLTTRSLENQIDHFLAVEKLTPYLHLPMLAGLNQGPGFPNLSCLGRLSDHVLARYVSVESVTNLDNHFLAGVDEAFPLDGPSGTPHTTPVRCV